MPTLASAFLAIEMLLVGMAARSETAADNLSAFEKRIGKYGGYSQS
jgi:hypothetical protein